LLKLIFHDRPFKVENADLVGVFGDPNILNAKISVIQDVYRIFRAKKLATLPIPDNMICPLSKHLFYHPVSASDGNTYELEEILRFIQLHGDRAWPASPGPSGSLPLPNATLVHNLNLRSEVYQFRQDHGLWQARMVEIPVANQPEATAAPARAARAPPAPRQTFQPQVSIADIMRMTPAPRLPELFKLDGFLNTITMAGLNLLLQHLTTTNGDFAHNTSKGTMIVWVVADQRALSMDFIVPFIDSSDWLGCIEKAGLNLILRTLGLQSGNQDEGKDSKIRRVLNTLPLKITVQDRYGSHVVEVKRSDSVQKFYADTLIARSMLKIDGTPLVYLNGPLSFYAIRHGSVIQNQIRAEVQPPPVVLPAAAAAASSGYNPNLDCLNNICIFVVRMYFANNAKI
jgi:hypothetical protein